MMDISRKQLLLGLDYELEIVSANADIDKRVGPTSAPKVRLPLKVAHDGIWKCGKHFTHRFNKLFRLYGF